VFSLLAPHICLYTTCHVDFYGVYILSRFQNSTIEEATCSRIPLPAMNSHHTSNFPRQAHPLLGNTVTPSHQRPPSPHLSSSSPPPTPQHPSQYTQPFAYTCSRSPPASSTASATPPATTAAPAMSSSRPRDSHIAYSPHTFLPRAAEVGRRG
jgi:hypothetical protein